MRPSDSSEKQRAAFRQWLPLSGGVLLAGLMVWSLTPAEPPCAYVVGQDGPATVATPARVVFTAPGEAATSWTCSSEGVSVPALPVHVSPSMFENPDTLVEATSITLHLSSTPVTREGHVLTLEGDKLLVLPRPGLPAARPEGDITEPFLTVDFGGGETTARYLPAPVAPGE
ncbi:MAG TPA: hypothetical protein VFZ09_41095 [Archangium sp.]|uniref:hypothetical protein n=1 Tax=Archangium sp. TaxID=1872627 RepID=UPI002E35A7EC|nr:hypothetical protein [Archangium sp.]HEX5752673.1 hypothetical protein [Archangium sp.]